MPDLVAAVTSQGLGGWGAGGLGGVEVTEPGIKRRRASAVPGVGLRLLPLRTNLRSAIIQLNYSALDHALPLSLSTAMVFSKTR